MVEQEERGPRQWHIGVWAEQERQELRWWDVRMGQGSCSQRMAMHVGLEEGFGL